MLSLGEEARMRPLELHADLFRCCMKPCEPSGFGKVPVAQLFRDFCVTGDEVSGQAFCAKVGAQLADPPARTSLVRLDSADTLPFTLHSAADPKAYTSALPSSIYSGLPDSGGFVVSCYSSSSAVSYEAVAGA